MLELWPYFLDELCRYGGGIPVSIGASIASDCIMAGMRAVFRGDPFADLRTRALKAIQSTIPDPDRQEAFWQALSGRFAARALSREEWCEILVSHGFEQSSAAGLYQEVEQKLSDLAVSVAEDNSRVFVRVVLGKLAALEEGERKQASEAMLAAYAQDSQREHTELRKLLEEILAESAGKVHMPAPHQLAPPPKDFTGRDDEINDLMIQIQRGGATISGLRGMGGIGKTALALMVAHQLAPLYPDGRVFLDLKGTSDVPLTASNAMAHVIRSCRPEDKLPESEAELRGLYQTCLYDRRVLLLMDNALSREQVELLIPPDGCALLITSRQHFTLPGLYAKDLDTLPPADARALLLKIAPRIGNQAGEIAGLCGHLPLALRAAASHFQITADLAVMDYIAQLRNERRRLREIGAEGVEHGPEACFALSYRRLEAETASVFRKLALFPGSFDAEAEAMICDDVGSKRLHQLVRLSLVEWDKRSQRHHLHDLVRLFARARLENSSDEYTSAQRRHAEHFNNVLAKAHELYSKGGDNVLRGLALFDLEWENINTGHAWAAAHAEEDRTATELCNAYPEEGVYILSLRLRPRERIAWLEMAVASARRLGARKVEGNHLGNLGNAYFSLGEAGRAIGCYRQWIEITQELGDRQGNGQALDNLGMAYTALGEPSRAIAYHEQSSRILGEVGDRRGAGNALGNLGNAYLKLGDARRAIECHEQALVIDRAIGNRRGEGQDLGNLGVAYAQLGDFRGAIGLLEQRLQIAREIGDRRGESNALLNISMAQWVLGERAQAIANAEATLLIFEQIEDPRTEMLREQLAEWREEEERKQE